ncbi:hypothetical protein C8Q80DRAFT_460968 [Daedaleopsis nitida]|nr:hypothetical protein C8Q80DRAFT_460968 [Daedaleopsis nitida]
MHALSLTRDETLRVLKAMGIDFPVDTKLSDNVLDKRLRDVLDASQDKHRLSLPSDLTSLPAWPLAAPGELDTSARSVFDAVKRGNLYEARKNIVKEMKTGRRDPPKLFVDPFVDLRQTIMGAGMMLDAGVRWWTLNDDEGQQCAITMRVVSVLEIDPYTPAIVVLYRPFDRSNGAACADWICRQSHANAPAVGFGFFGINATPLEQKVVHKLLKANAHLLPSDFAVQRHPDEEHFKLSVLLPVGPLDFDALAKLNEKQGCVLCGKKTTSRCSQCQSVSYCGIECQRADWKDHKHTCRTLKDSRWCAATFRRTLPGPGDQRGTIFNRFGGDPVTTLFHDPRYLAETPPPDVWGDKVFLVKMQVPLVAGPPGNMLLYDIKRSFHVYIIRADNPAVFAELYAEMTGPRGGHRGLKMYRWAKRTGDWQLEICVDREPNVEVKW